jgi:protein phosphatase inhibitor 2
VSKKVLTSLLFCPAQAKHEAFLLARGRHYSNEAEAMKRAQQLIEDEDEDAEGSMELDDEAEEEAPRTSRGKVPPVPPLPSNINGVGK